MGKKAIEKKEKIVFPRRGEIYLVGFDPAKGAEIKKTRPALILQNDMGNYYSSTTIVAPITSQSTAEVYDFEVLLNVAENGLNAISKVKLDQVRVVDKSRLKKRLGKLNPNTQTKVDQALKVSLGLVDLS